MSTTHPAPPPAQVHPDDIRHDGVRLRPLAQWPTYHAGDDGHIYSVKNGTVRRLIPIKNRKLDYATVTLYHPDVRYARRLPSGKTCWTKRPCPQYIHLLVASAWLGAKPGPEHTIDHRNEDKLDNRPSNLRWLLGLENTFEYYRNHPLVVSGERNGFAKLTDDEGRRLLALRGRVTQRMAAGMFGVSETTVWGIWNGKRWRHLQGAGAVQN